MPLLKAPRISDILYHRTALYASEDNEIAAGKFGERIVYLDQAATSRPKAAGVGEAMRAYVEDVCANVNRSTYAPATEAARVVLDTRERLCALFGADDPALRCSRPATPFR
jgi:selenocysteine lyase/cysteine desulfurase